MRDPQITALIRQRRLGTVNSAARPKEPPDPPTHVTLKSVDLRDEQPLLIDNAPNLIVTSVYQPIAVSVAEDGHRSISDPLQNDASYGPEQSRRHLDGRMAT